MKAAIISMQSTSSRWTAEAMKKYFDEVDDLNLKDIEVNVAAQCEALYLGKPIQCYDCIYVKGSFRYASILRSITEIMSQKGVYCPIEGKAFTTGHDKFLTHLELAKHNIPMPKTYISPTVFAAKVILKKMSFPVIMKIPHGTQGKGVVFAESYAAASSMLDTLNALKQPFIIQEYIETGGKDVRAIVVGDKVVAGMQRISTPDEKRSNIHAGGSGLPVSISPRAKKIAIDAAKAIGAEICGVDILEGPTGPLVIEVNLSPGLQGITQATEINVADKIAKYLSEMARSSCDKGMKKETNEIMKTLSMENGAKSKSHPTTIITNLGERGEKLILPPLVSKISGIDDKKEVTVTVEKGKILIEENMG